MKEKVYIVVLNWNGWQDTINCLKSIFNQMYENYQIVVCDNNSTDMSIYKIKYFLCSIKKTYLELTEKDILISDQSADVIIIKNAENYGFAGGNNVAIKYALNKNDLKYVWVLNNDTVVTNNALSSLVSKMESDTKIGICGSTLLYYNAPEIIQCCGGAMYNKWFSLGYPIHNGKVFTRELSLASENIKFDYIAGASMLVSKDFLDNVGLMSEDYFLYYEELDWAIRGSRHKKKYLLAYAPDSIVLHKEGASTKGGKNFRERSLLSDYYGLRNRILFTKKYYRYALPSVYVLLVLLVFLRLYRGQHEHFKQGLKVLYTFVMNPNH